MRPTKAWQAKEEELTRKLDSVLPSLDIVQSSLTVPLNPILRSAEVMVPGRTGLTNVEVSVIFGGEYGIEHIINKCIWWEWSNVKSVTAPLQECLKSFRKLADSD